MQLEKLREFYCTTQSDQVGDELGDLSGAVVGEGSGGSPGGGMLRGFYDYMWAGSSSTPGITSQVKEYGNTQITNMRENYHDQVTI